ncbi:MAG: type II toxin-antitoxin system RelE/ParE family toxin [Pseudomonadota bacterium]
MIRAITLRQRAIADIDDIWDYTVTTHGAAQAVNYLSGLEAAFGLLAEFPEIARARTEFTPPVRIHPHQQHLILYQNDEVKIDIIRVVHRRANWSEFLSE